jgi:hypothetical protein
MGIFVPCATNGSLVIGGPGVGGPVQMGVGVQSEVRGPRRGLAFGAATDHLQWPYPCTP